MHKRLIIVMKGDGKESV